MALSWLTYHHNGYAATNVTNNIDWRFFFGRHHRHSTSGIHHSAANQRRGVTSVNYVGFGLDEDIIRYCQISCKGLHEKIHFFLLSVDDCDA